MILRFNKPNEITNYIGMDDAIYHFTRKATAIEYILNNQNLKLGSFSQTNDPQEYRRRMTSVAGREWEDDSMAQISKVTRTVDIIIKSSGFLSFCQNRYDSEKLIEHGCLKSRMWSQYGDNQAGVCLVFSRDSLIKQVEKQLSQSHDIYSQPVTYKDPYESSSRNYLNVDGNELNELSPESIAFDHVKNEHGKIFFQKQPDYEDENEFRIVVVDKNISSANGTFIDTSSCLKLIILGDSFPRVYLPTVQSLSIKNNIPYMKLHWEKHSYVLLRWEK